MKISEEPKFYDINKRFYSNEEKLKIFKQQSCLRIAKDMVVNPEDYSFKQVEIVEKTLRDLESELNEALVILNSEYREDGLFRLNHMLDVFVLDEHRLQELDNLTLSFILTAQINTTIDLIIVLTHNLIILKECELFNNCDLAHDDELDEIKDMNTCID